MFINIIFWLGSDSGQAVGTSFFHACFTFLHIHASLLTFFVCLFLLFPCSHSCCSHAPVFVKILVHEYPISYSHTKWYFIFFLSLVQERLNMHSGCYYRQCVSRPIVGNCLVT